jgi:hypothetical protein
VQRGDQRLLAAQEQQRSLSGLWGEAIDDDAIPIGEDVVDAAPAKAPTGKGKKKQGFDEAALDALGDDAFMQAAER